MYVTTLNEIKKQHPCKSGWTKLLKHLGKTKADDEPLPLLTILESNGLDDALWCLQALGPGHAGAIRLMACDFAETALPYTTDPRPAQTIEVARRYARGEATDEELAAARDAAWDAGAGEGSGKGREGCGVGCCVGCTGYGGCDEGRCGS